MLSKYEKETILLTSEGDTTVRLETFNSSLKKRLAEFCRKYPECAHLENETREGSVMYTLDKSRVSLRFIPPYSEDRRNAARANGKKIGFQTVSD